MKNKFQLPAVQKVSETDLDHYSRQYLQTLVDNNVVVSWRTWFRLNNGPNPWEEGKNRICYRRSGYEKFFMPMSRTVELLWMLKQQNLTLTANESVCCSCCRWWCYADDNDRIKFKCNIGVVFVVFASDLVTSVDFVVVIVYFLNVDLNNIISFQSLVITDDVVKIYRNYVIIYSLRDVISQVYTCVSSI